MNLNSGYAVIDLEMTGLDHERESIIEIAVGVVSTTHGQILIDTERVMVNFGGEVPFRIQQLTGITTHQVQSQGVSIDDALAWFAKRTHGLHLVGHDVFASDRPFLIAETERHQSHVQEGRVPGPALQPDPDLNEERFVDTAALYKGYRLGMYPDEGESHPQYSHRLRDIRAWNLRTGLQAACEDLDISAPMTRYHRATGDVLHTHRLFRKLLELNPPH